MFDLNVPVVFVTFNRPDTTKIVFEQIRNAHPSRLYLVSDAARKYIHGEEESVAGLRTYMEESVDWECDVVKLYADKNMGCARRVSTALDEVFAREEMAIILEDDCVPDHSFFEFCQTMLQMYKNNNRIMSVCGSLVVDYLPRGGRDYFFSKVFGCWGWATWRRAWEKFDYSMSGFDINKTKPLLKDVIFCKRAYCDLTAQFISLARSEEKFSWAAIFYYYAVVNNGYHIYPKFNLIKNIGFTQDSTHTERKPDYYNAETKSMSFPIKELTGIEREVDYDLLVYQNVNRYGFIVKLKQIMGLDINKSVFDCLR